MRTGEDASVPNRGNAEKGMRTVLWGVLGNAVLALIKVFSGVFGHSYALVADGVESVLDIFSSLLVWKSLHLSTEPPDAEHPYGHGKAEPLAAMVVAMALGGAAVLLAIQSVREILTPHNLPAWWTLAVLVVVVGTKETLFRRMLRVGEEVGSTAMRSDAWHHRSDALTSLAAFVGILLALILGPGFESADDWATLVACGIIGWNGYRLFHPAISEVMDAAPSGRVETSIREVALSVPGVQGLDKCLIRKSGLRYFVDLHVGVAGALSVTQGHAIAHCVKDALRKSPLRIADVLVHIEPASDPRPDLDPKHMGKDSRPTPQTLK